MHPGNFSPHDPDRNCTKIAESMLGHLAQGKPPVQPPASGARDQRLGHGSIVVGDWGTGLGRDRQVAVPHAEEIAGALAERPGGARRPPRAASTTPGWRVKPAEVPRLLARYAAQAASGVTSWSLNGNHDMYSGGYGTSGRCSPTRASRHSTRPMGSRPASSGSPPRRGTSWPWIPPGTRRPVDRCVRSCRTRRPGYVAKSGGRIGAEAGAAQPSSAHVPVRPARSRS